MSSTCTIPLSAKISAAITLASSIIGDIVTSTVTSNPFNVVTSPLVKSPEATDDPNTWCNKISDNLGSANKSAADIPALARNALNAASVGANTV